MDEHSSAQRIAESCPVSGREVSRYHFRALATGDSGPRISATAIDSFSRQIRRVDTFDELIETVRAEVSLRFGLTNAWLYVCEGDDDSRLVLVAAAGPKAAAIREIVPI